MKPKEILIKSLKNEKTDRAPWVPFVGVHGGKLLGLTATEYLKSGVNIAAGILKSVELYQPDGIPILFDLQLEAEMLGCELQWADKLPPSVTSHPLEKKELTDLPEFYTDQGRYLEIAKACQLVKNNIQDDIALYGLITGPFTLALHLLGYNIFLDMLNNPDKLKRIISFCTEVGIKSAEFYLGNGIDVIAVVDPMVSQISPENFLEFSFPYLNKIFDFIRAQGKISSLFVCGDATRNLEMMCRTSCDNISIDENISLEYLKDLSRKYNKSFGGNLKLTSTLLFGTELEAQKEAISCLDIGGNTGFILAPGCDLPYDTPENNLMAIAEIVHDNYKRKIAKALVLEETNEGNTIELVDYSKSDKVIIEVVTLDSGSCPPCFYMVDAVKQVTADILSKVEIHEYKISTKIGLAYMRALKVQTIPTICINGEIAFSSIIPDQESLRKKIKQFCQTEPVGV